MKPTLRMAWHILKKDSRLLWPLILGAAGIQFASEGLRYAMDRTVVTQTLINLSNLLQAATILASVLLIAAAVHLDAVPGVRQDWLVRPIRRRDLLLAKLLFVVLMVQGPILLADLIAPLGHGFPLTQALGAALSRNLYLFLGLSLPALAFVSLTRNLAEAVVGGVVSALVFSVLQILLNNSSELWPLRGTGLFWIGEAGVLLVAAAGSVAVLSLQYFRRKTVRARWAMAGVALLTLLAYLAPWNLAFRLEQHLSRSPGAGGAIAPSFEPGLGRFRLPEAITHNFVSQSGGSVLRDEAATVYLPIRLTGIADGMVLKADRVQVLFFDATGRVIHQGSVDDLLVRKEDAAEPVHFTIGARRLNFLADIGPEGGSLPKQPASSDAGVLVYQGLAVPPHLYQRIKNQTLRIELDYSLTLLRSASYSLPALGGNLQIPGAGRCATAMDNDADDIELTCFQAGGMSNCASAFLEHAPSGRRNPVRFSCSPTYSPYFGQYVPDAMTRFGVGLRFRDPSGLTKYPVDSSQLAEARVVLRVYQAQDHFTRRVVIPSVRLSDWTSLEHDAVVASR